MASFSVNVLSFNKFRKLRFRDFNGLVSVFTLAIKTLLHDLPNSWEGGGSSDSVAFDVMLGGKLNFDQRYKGLLQVGGPDRLLVGDLETSDFTTFHGELNRVL